MSQGIIYIIINRNNGYKYIGQSLLSQNKVWQHHIQSAIRMSQEPLHKAMRKYGNHNFMIKELDDCNESILNEREQYWIDQYKPEYNGDIEVIEKEDIIEVIEEPIIKKEKVSSFKFAENRGNGKHLATKIMSVNIETGEERIWDSVSEAAIELTGDIKKSGNISRAMTNGYKCYDHLWKRLEQSKHSIKVYGVNKMTWERTRTFESIKEAAKYVGCENCIRRSIRNPRRNSHKGYYWFRE